MLRFAGRQAGQFETPVKLGRLDWIDEADLVGEYPTIARGLDPKCPATLAVRPGVRLESDPRVDPEPQQETLHPPDEVLGDHVDFHDCRGLMGRDEPLGLEDALEVNGDDW